MTATTLVAADQEVFHDPERPVGRDAHGLLNAQRRSAQPRPKLHPQLRAARRTVAHLKRELVSAMSRAPGPAPRTRTSAASPGPSSPMMISSAPSSTSATTSMCREGSPADPVHDRVRDRLGTASAMSACCARVAPWTAAMEVTSRRSSATFLGVAATRTARTAVAAVSASVAGSCLRVGRVHRPTSSPARGSSSAAIRRARLLGLDRHDIAARGARRPCRRRPARARARAEPVELVRTASYCSRRCGIVACSRGVPHSQT